MKKLSWSGLDFLRRDRGAIARETNSNTSSQLGTNRWSSESKLMTDTVSHRSSDFNQEKTISNRGRLSFSDLIRLRRNPSEPSLYSEPKTKSSILDTLKRKFKIARSEHSRLRQMNKRHSFSLSISSIAEESCDRDSLPKSKTLPAVQQTCKLCSVSTSTSKSGRVSCCDIHSELDTLSENQDDHNDNSLSTVQVSPSIITLF